MTQKITLLILSILLTSFSLQAKQIFVSPSGDDSNSGTIDSPFWSVQQAQSVASAGDTVYIRGGEYAVTEDDISHDDGTFASITYLNKSGSNGNLIKYWAYPGEQPVFNLSAVKPDGRRNVAFRIACSYIHMKGIEITGLQVTITTHTESYCVYSKGSNNIFENLNMHDNKGTGLRHFNGGNNLFLNCDAYRNHDNVSENKLGGNSDGFGCHPSSSGTGNVFKGCRAWFNSDDGYDCIRADAAIIFDSCWSMYNGYSPSFASLGDGNGFKIGGFAYDEDSKIPNPVPSHTVTHCIAVQNKANGFYANHHLAGNTWLNNTAYLNGNRNYNMNNRPTREDNTNIDGNGYDHVLKNNLSYKPVSGHTVYIDASQNTLATNSWEINTTLTDDDFHNLNQEPLVFNRKADGRLPDIKFMAIDSTSELFDAGTDIGFPFSGDAPEIGALESPINLNSDATLSNLMVDSIAIENFSDTVYSYTYIISDTTIKTPPLVSATKNDTKAFAPIITNATNIPGSATVTVFAEDGTKKVYTINFIYAPTSDINFLETNKIHIYPNPAKDVLLIKNINIKQAWIVDLTGRQQSVDIINNSIDVSGFAKGIYFLKMTDTEDTIICKRVIIER
jgi:hypothetical protein